MVKFDRMPVKGPITGGFGADYGTYLHRGVDISCVVGTPIISPAWGEVIQSGERGTFGRVVLLKHSDGWYTIYAHLSEPLVSAGSFVEAGTLLGKSGNTGLSTGPHLHWQLSSTLNFGDITTSRDPLKYLMTPEEHTMEEKRIKLLRAAWHSNYREVLAAYDKLAARGYVLSTDVRIKGDGSVEDLNEVMMRRIRIAEAAYSNDFAKVADAL